MIETFLYFFRLGCLGFGGPLAIIAQMQTDLIENKKWMQPEQFLTALPLIKALPGPVAFQVAVFIGRHRAGLMGAFAAAFGLVLPSFTIMIFFAKFTTELTKNLWTEAFLTGLQVAALGVILASVRGLAIAFYRTIEYWAFFVLAFILIVFVRMYEPVVIVLVGLTSIFYFRFKSRLFFNSRFKSLVFPFSIFALPLVVTSSTLSDLALICFKAGAFVFGTGVAIIPILEKDFVDRLHWISHKEFLQALALGQVTPGPVVITVTYIGYKVGAVAGAVIATLSIFTPSFTHMVTWFPHVVQQLSQKTWIKYFLIGSNAAVACSIVVSVLNLSRSIHMDVFEGFLALGVLFTSLFTKIPVWLLIPLGGAIYLLKILVFQ